ILLYAQQNTSHRSARFSEPGGARLRPVTLPARRQSLLPGALLVLLSMLASHAALAQPAPSAAGPPPPARERITLAYSAPSECPGTDTFHDEVRSRVADGWEAAPGELARRITITVAKRGERYVASIEFRNPQGQNVARSVAGQNCEDVVNGIALVTALAIESRVDEALEESEPAA